MQINDIVYWNLNTWIGTVIERVGIIKAIVPCDTHPNTLGFGIVVSKKMCTRSKESYLVSVPTSKGLLWISTLVLCPVDKLYLLNEQKPLTTTKEHIDRRDRLKLKKLCKSLGVDFLEGTDSLSVPTWCKRFWFKSTMGLEAVNSVERLKLY